jgi:hypothetical protein
MADRKTVKIQSGGNTVVIGKAELGFSPADSNMRNFQVSCNGLGGGTFTVSYYPASCSHLIEFQAAAPETAAVVASQSIDFLYDALVITFDGLPVGADPSVHATFWHRPTI